MAEAEQVLKALKEQAAKSELGVVWARFVGEGAAVALMVVQGLRKDAAGWTKEEVDS